MGNSREGTGGVVREKAEYVVIHIQREENYIGNRQAGIGGGGRKRQVGRQGMREAGAHSPLPAHCSTATHHQPCHAKCHAMPPAAMACQMPCHTHLPPPSLSSQFTTPPNPTE